MKPAIFLIITCFFQLSVFGQSVKVFSINSNGTKGQLLRVEKYQNNQLLELQQFDKKGLLEFTISNTYNADNQLIKEIKTFKQGHEYDFITEYDYDSKGRKIYKLRGNNRTGKWSSEGYTYTAQGELDTIFFYQKNGDLTNLRVFTYSYTEGSKKQKVVRKDIDLETEEVTQSSTSIYEYEAEGFDQKVSELDEVGQVIFTEWTNFNLNQQPKTVVFQMPDLPKVKTVFYYNARQECIKKEEFTNDALTTTTTLKYNSKGKIIELKYKTQNGYSGEIYAY